MILIEITHYDSYGKLFRTWEIGGKGTMVKRVNLCGKRNKMLEKFVKGYYKKNGIEIETDPSGDLIRTTMPKFGCVIKERDSILIPSWYPKNIVKPDMIGLNKLLVGEIKSHQEGKGISSAYSWHKKYMKSIFDLELEKKYKGRMNIAGWITDIEAQLKDYLYRTGALEKIGKGDLSIEGYKDMEKDIAEALRFLKNKKRILDYWIDEEEYDYCEWPEGLSEFHHIVYIRDIRFK